MSGQAQQQTRIVIALRGGNVVRVVAEGCRPEIVIADYSTFDRNNVSVDPTGQPYGLERKSTEVNDTFVSLAFEQAEAVRNFINYYRCPEYKHKWQDQWTATCNDRCPKCGLKEIEPYRSEDA